MVDMPTPNDNVGLTAEEAAQRLTDEGPNSLPGEGGRGWTQIVLGTVKDPMFSLLLAAAGLYLLLGDLREGSSLLLMVVVVIGLTLYQEGKTERAVQALRQLSSPRARVIRDGQPLLVSGLEVVRGDLMQLAEGDRIAADALLISGSDLLVDESLLTGESVPVDKSIGQTLHAGTLLVRGQARAVVSATGVRSQMGQIGQALQSVTSEESPLRLQTARLVRRMAWLGAGLSLSLVLLLVLRNGEWLPALLSGIALAISMLPEEFVVVLTVLPALGAWRLSRQQVLTRHLAAIETLGATSVLCADKTGTLTINRMQVAQMHVAGTDWMVQDADQGSLPEPFADLVDYAILASQPDPYDPMELAFHRLGKLYQLGRLGASRRDENLVLVHQYPLQSELRVMTNVWSATSGSQNLVATKGSPEAVSDICHLDLADRAQLAAAADAMANKGLRVLAVAKGRGDRDTRPKNQQDFEFQFLGLLGLADPLRPEIPKAVAECHEAGIRVIMITGDYPVTAQAIATQAGLSASQVLVGDELDQLDDDRLGQRLRTTSICARITPVQKLRIVKALQAEGAVVAMTGDGVNDAPALKAAHVGVSMGARGTDVAREASDIVLVDDNFASIVRAIRQGRRIYTNLRRSMRYILAVHVPIAGMALFPLLFGWPVVLFPIHIAMLELAIDPACALVFENEPADKDVMQHPPRDLNESLISGLTLAHAVLQGLGVLAWVLVTYAWALQTMQEQEARALAFSTLVLGNLALILFNRAGHRPLLESLRSPNQLLWWVSGFTLVLLGAAVYVAPIAQTLRMEALSLNSILLAASATVGIAMWFVLVRRWTSRDA